MKVGLFKRRVYLSLVIFVLLLLWAMVSGVFAEEGVKEGEGKSVEESRQPEDRWRFGAGGEVRIRGEFARNQNFTDFAFTPRERESQFLERTRLHGSVENPALGLKLFVQPQWYGRWGGIDRRSDADIYQGYVEWEKILGFPVSLKVGRQDFSYGSTFLLGPNDFYNGLSWDGFKLNLAPDDRFSVDLLGLKMAKLNSGDPNIYLMGTYATYKVYKEGTLDGYLLYHKGGFPFPHREFEVTDSDQKFFNLGVRLAGELEGFDYEIEPQIQWGRVKNVTGDGKDRVRAYGGHMDLGYTFKLPWEPRVFGAYAFSSGDNDPFDKRFKEFHGNIFNDNYLVGDMSVIGDLSGVTVEGIRASGMKVLVGGISFNPLSDLNLNLDVHHFRAMKVPSGFSKNLGFEVNLVGCYKLIENIAFLAGLNRFFTGRFFEQASGSKKNIDYGYIQTQIEF